MLDSPAGKANHRLTLICPSITRTRTRSNINSDSDSDSDSDTTITPNMQPPIVDSSIDTGNAETIRCSSIDIVNAQSMKKGTFRRDYFARQRPVLITGGLTAGQGKYDKIFRLQFWYISLLIYAVHTLY